MQQDDILVKLTDIFRRTLENEELDLRLDDSSRSVEGWDSLNHAILIHQIEKAFEVKFNMREMLSLNTVGDICSLLSKKL